MARRPLSGLRTDNPAFPLLQALISYWGVTSADGGAGGANLQCADLATQPEFDGNHVVIISGPYGGQARDINGTTLAGVVTPASNFGGVITASTIFAILPIRTTPAEVAALTALVNAIEVKLDAGGLGVGLVTKALTFANDNGQVPLFTVTGDVIVRMVAITKATCGTAGGCNVSVGIAGIVDAFIPVTDITLLVIDEIWHDATPDKVTEALSTLREYIISDGNDITLNSSAADNSGAVTFYCFWTALSAGATVVAA